MSVRPNVILFLTDDHAPWTLPCYGNTEVRAPVFDRMAQDGVLFRHAFTPTPVCSPGRACLLTGLTSSQHGVHDWIAMHDPECQERDWLAGQVTLAEALSREGYTCGLSGKWNIGQCYQAPRGYDWYFGFARQGPHMGVTTYVHEGRALVREGNVTEIVTEQAIGFLNSASDDQPFFLQIGYTDTHSPYIGQDPELVASYSEATFRDIQVDDPHPWSWNEGFAEGAEISEDAIRTRHMNQYAAVTDIDRHMGMLLEALEASGRAEDTVVIYTSDHGLSLGQNGFWGKGNGTRPLNMYDVSIRVPLLATGPGFARGGECERCVDHFDTFQTICEVCGVPPERLRLDTNYPGRSYLSIATGSSTQDWYDTRYGEYGDLRTARTPEYKLIRRFPSGPDDLFDLRSDPGEKVNLIDHPDLQPTRAELSARIDAFYALHDDPEKSGLRANELPRHNCPQKPGQETSSEAWRDTIRESRGLQIG